MGILNGKYMGFLVGIDTVFWQLGVGLDDKHAVSMALQLWVSFFHTADSKTLEHGCRMIFAGVFLLSLVWDW